MSENKTHIEKLQEFLDYTQAFEKKARELLYAPKRDNREVKTWLHNESEGLVKRYAEFNSFIQNEGKDKALNDVEAFMLRQKIKASMKEIQHLVVTICILPTPELEEMQK